MYNLIIKKNSKEWRLKKKAHRINGPAIEYLNGENWWCKNGFRHRENNLPAIIRKDGNKEYWENGQEYILEENGTKAFIDFHGNLHKDLLPAVEYSNGDQEWWRWGKRHRENGPAVIIGNKQFWFEDGEFIKCIV